MKRRHKAALAALGVNKSHRRYIETIRDQRATIAGLRETLQVRDRDLDTLRIRFDSVRFHADELRRRVSKLTRSVADVEAQASPDVVSIVLPVIEDARSADYAASLLRAILNAGPRPPGPIAIADEDLVSDDLPRIE